VEDLELNQVDGSLKRGQRTHKRPYTSDKGAANKGPIANERRKMLRVNARTVGLVILNFMATSGKPGAIIELANGETKV
jgi:hypothetical protein